MPYQPGALVHGVIHVDDVYHSNDVYANYVPIALWNDPQGSEAAVLTEIFSPSFASNNLVTSFDGDEDEATVDRALQEAVAAGIITQEELDAGKNPVKGSEDGSIGTTATAISTVTTVSGTDFPDTYLLHSGIKQWTIGSITKQPDVCYSHQVVAQAGLTLPQIVANLQLLVINCIDPIKRYRSDMLLTNSFRSASSSSGTSQHPKGMACDMQFSKAGKADYYTIAQWIRDNILFDQLLLEYKTTGTKMPWIHVSFNVQNNRRQIMTFMNDKKYSTGLVDLSST